MGNSGSSCSDGPVDISSFKLQQVIGKGGFGLVRIVTKKDTKQKYALKYINKQKCIRKQSVRNIFRERVILEKCDHPFIINLQFAFQDYEHMFMILDLATGGDLRFHLVRNGNLPNQTLRIYAAEIASALHYLHMNHILHRDIKPENLLVDEQGHIRITDFNVAILLDEKIPTSKSGTTSYMAPEMFLKLPYAYSVDWWALGVVLYECTYNTHPFHCFKKIPIEAAIQKCEIKIPAAIDVHVGKFSFEFDIDQQNFIKGLLEKKIDDRLGCGPGGFVSQIQTHDWFGSIDWELLYLRKIVPEFVPNANQNNFDFGPALEELLYESAPLQSKPVKKKKSRFDAPSLSSLWEDEHSLSKKKAAAVKLEQELEYIEEYFLPYSKEADTHGIDIFAMSHGKIRERPHYSEDSSATIIESSMGDSCAASVRSSRPKNDSLPPRSQSSNAASVLSPNSENHTPHSQVEILQRSVREIEISGNRKSGLDGRSSRLE